MLKNLLLAAALTVSIPSFCQFSGNALDLDGANDMVVINSVPSFFSSPGTSDFTIEAWVNPRGSAFQRIFFAQPSATNFASLGTSTGNVIYFYVIVNGTTYSVATSTSITQNAWTHVAARWTAATSSPQVFFNGVLQPGAAGGGSSTGTSGLTVIGSRPGGAQYFNGMLDEVRVWSEARTQCGISNNYMHSITGVQPNLVMNYDFNQGVPAGNNTGVITLPDNSGNSYNGTLTNFTLTGSTSNWVVSAATLTTQGSPLAGVTTTQTASVCSGGSFTFPDGTTQTNINTTTTHTSTLTAVNGCDSLINSTINVLPNSTFAEAASLCVGSSYTFPDATTFTNITANFSHISTLVNAAGCDSVITTSINILQPTTSSQSAMVCSGSSFTFPDGSVTANITAQTIEMDTLFNQAGCDSVITTTVDVYPVYSASDSFAICYGSNYTFYDGTTVNGIVSPTFHTSLLTSVNGCDSAITTSLGIISVDTMVTMLNETLTANASGATYQWLDCGNGYQPIAGDTNQTFTATVNGSYALAITENGCTDTSGCYVILSTGISSQVNSSLLIFPNPTEGVINISTSAVGGTVTLMDVTGKVIKVVQMTTSTTQLDLSEFAAGTYFIAVSSGDDNMIRKIQKD